MKQMKELRKHIKAEINGIMKTCDIIEYIGYNPDIGKHIMEIESDGKKHMIVKEGQKWRNWTVQDRLGQ